MRADLLPLPTHWNDVPGVFRFACLTLLPASKQLNRDPGQGPGAKGESAQAVQWAALTPVYIAVFTAPTHSYVQGAPQLHAATLKR
jgi:hypothetical protein